VALAEALQERGLLKAGEGKPLEVTGAGAQWFSQALSIDIARRFPADTALRGAIWGLDGTMASHRRSLGDRPVSSVPRIGLGQPVTGTARAVELSRRSAAETVRTLGLSIFTGAAIS